MEQTVDEVRAEDERRFSERTGGIALEQWREEQSEIWTDAAWASVIENLQDGDDRLQRMVKEAIERRSPEQILVAVLDVMFPLELRGADYSRVVARLERIRPMLMANLQKQIVSGRAEAWPHLVAKHVCNAVLRGMA